MGREQEFSEFVTAALPRLLRLAYMLTGNGPNAEDLVQTALARSWNAWRLRRIDDLPSFVRRVMINSYASWYTRSRGKELALDAIPEVPNTVDETGQVDERDALRRALLALPSRQRAVIVLRYYEDLSELEIAGIMGTTPGTVKSQASRALKRLGTEFAATERADWSTNGAASE